MDGPRFDHLAQRLAQAGAGRTARRGLLAVAVALVTGTSVAHDAGAAERRRQRRGDDAAAEACIPTGKRCPAPKPRGRKGNGKQGKKPKQLSCRQCCQRRVTTNANGKRVCFCAETGTACTETRECCDGTCTGGVCQSAAGAVSPPPPPPPPPPPAGCTPTTCAAQGANCGSIPDGCGGAISCGSCSGATPFCVNNVCSPCSGSTPCPGGFCCASGSCVASCPICQTCSGGVCVADAAQESTCCNGPTGQQWCQAGSCAPVPAQGTITQCRGACGFATARPVAVCGATMACPTCVPSCLSGCDSFCNSIVGPLDTGYYCVNVVTPASGAACPAPTQFCAPVACVEVCVP